MGEDLQTLLDQKHSLEQELASFPLVGKRDHHYTSLPCAFLAGIILMNFYDC